jgi:hypothetical protein
LSHLGRSSLLSSTSPEGHHGSPVVPLFCYNSSLFILCFIQIHVSNSCSISLCDINIVIHCSFYLVFIFETNVWNQKHFLPPCDRPGLTSFVNLFVETYFALYYNAFIFYVIYAPNKLAPLSGRHGDFWFHL